MPVAWYPKRWWNFSISENEKKKKWKQFLLRTAFDVYRILCMKTLYSFSCRILRHIVQKYILENIQNNLTL